MIKSKSFYKEQLDKLLHNVLNGVALKIALQNYSETLKKYFGVNRCGIAFFEGNPLLAKTMVSYPKTGNENIPADIDRNTIPWLIDTERKDIGPHLNYTHLNRSHPLKTSVNYLFGKNLNVKNILIYPFRHWEKVTGSILLVYQIEKRVFSTDELRVLKNAARQVEEAIKKVIDMGTVRASEKILSHLNDYLESGKKSEVNRNIIIEALQKVFDVRSVLILKKDEIRGNKYFHAVLDGKGKIKETHFDSFDDGRYNFMMNEAEKDNPELISVSIMQDDELTGKFYLEYQPSNHVFQQNILMILQNVAPRLVELLYY